MRRCRANRRGCVYDPERKSIASTCFGWSIVIAIAGYGVTPQVSLHEVAVGYEHADAFDYDCDVRVLKYAEAD